ncbi:MAG: flagellar type III secretion system protein FliR [Candidatus Liberibacter ctenarytainae]|uniref:Flagellar type III secretion system protein FliR n=1 Tax=Candidatus Liberibacter ctenarytainae TaxID=2020335 RepID=A0A937AE96_9HYPH|nr:flagellar type III secretion system protein FliR [Candidatus Liberibacter ctenarytainae]
MKIVPEVIIMSFFLIFCRIGSCIMLLPGFSAPYIPTQVRLIISMALSVILFPFFWDTIYPHTFIDRAYYLKLIIMELSLGGVYGFFMRVYTLGLQFLGNIISSSIGLNPPPGMSVVEATAETSFSSFIGVVGLLALWTTDFHHHIFYALVQSYKITPIGGQIDLNNILVSLTNILQETFTVMLRLSNPFLFFCIVFNFAIGLLNKLVPQIPVYFISTPYMVGLGYLFLCSLIEIIIHQISYSFQTIFNNI